ncbi:MAG: YihY/virulence factor BrkB family protein [Acidobacteriota bacterium]|nr:YihY/virulence factor BrkB family protein [Acidobacteriota bacterium]
MRRLSRYSAIMWSRGGLGWSELLKQLVLRSRDHKLSDRAALLSFYFLVALFPLLIVLFTLIGLLLASQTATYLTLLNYLDRIMPLSAFGVLNEVLGQLTSGASGSNLSLAAVIALWSASSGVTALIEALNVAFDVPNTRSWWHRRLVALGLTLGIGLLLLSSLVFLFASSAVARVISARLPILSELGEISDVVRWLVGLLLLFFSLTIIYSFGPNLNRKRWEGILPGACLALVCWLIASACLRLYLSTFASLHHSYGSLAGVIALLFWLYLSGAAIVIGGELNAIIWHASIGPS